MKKTLIALSLIMLSGCALITKGSTESVSIITESENTTIYVDDIKYGKESVLAKLKKGKKHTIKVKQKGCESVVIQTEEAFDATSLLGIFLDFGIISLPTDAISGAMWKIEPSQYRVNPICKES